MVKISIISPCFNDGLFLEEAFESIELSKYRDVFEHIVINDGSTDNFTLKKIYELEAKGSIVIHQENNGLAKARNAGIKIAKGKYILPLDSDNKIIPEVLLELLEILESDSSVDVAYTYALFSGERSGIWEVGDFDLRKIIFANYIDACALIRKSKIEKLQMYSTDMPVMGHEDWDLWIKIGFDGGKFHLLKKPGFYYRVSSKSMVNTISSPNVNQTLSYIFKKYKEAVKKLYNDSYSFKIVEDGIDMICKDYEIKKNIHNTVIIPIYKNLKELGKEELISLKQCLKIFYCRHLCLIGPPEIDWREYIKYFDTKGKKVDIKIFKSSFFSSINGYNELMTSIKFFKRFTKCKYILIYQLDAFVFRDELDYWCSKGYDYIGAPWTGIYLYKNKPLDGVGNGGFSIRNVNNSIRILRDLQVLSILNLYSNLNWRGLIPRMPKLLLTLIGAFKSPKPLLDFNIHEDLFWCKVAPSSLDHINFNSDFFDFLSKLLIRNKFKIAPKNIALQFSFETEARKLYKLNNYKLPFGCHGWMKYSADFWKSFIPEINLVELKDE